MIMFYYFYFLPWLWNALEHLDRALYKLSFIYYLLLLLISKQGVSAVSDIEERASFCDLQRNQSANCGEV